MKLFIGVTNFPRTLIESYSIRELREFLEIGLKKLALSRYGRPIPINYHSKEKFEVIFDGMADIVNFFFIHQTKRAQVHMFNFTPKMQTKLEEFIQWMAKSNMFILKKHVEQFASHMLFKDMMSSYIINVLEGGIQGVCDPSPRAEFSMLEPLLNLFGHLPALQFPPNWLDKFQSVRPSLRGISFLDAVTYFDPNVYPEVVKSWFNCFWTYRIKHIIYPHQIFILTETAIARVPSKDDLENHDLLVGCYFNQQMQFLDNMKYGKNFLKTPIITEWMSGAGDRFLTEYYLQGMFETDNENVKKVLKDDKIYFHQLSIDPVINAIEQFHEYTKKRPGERVIVISSHFQNWYLMYDLCQQNKINAIFLPDNSSHFLNPVESRLSKHLQHQMSYCMFQLQLLQTNKEKSPGSLLNLLWTYKKATEVLYRKLNIVDAVQNMLYCLYDTYGLSRQTCNELLLGHKYAVPIFYQKAFEMCSEPDPYYLSSPSIQSIILEKLSEYIPDGRLAWADVEELGEVSSLCEVTLLDIQRRDLQDRYVEVTSEIVCLSRQIDQPYMFPNGETLDSETVRSLVESNLKYKLHHAKSSRSD